MDKKFGLLKGLSEIFICEIEDTPEGYKPVGTPEQLIPAGELTISKAIEKAQTYYDNSMYAESGMEAPSEMSIIGAAVRAAFLAKVEGKDIDPTTGAIIDDGDWHEKYYAISGKKDYTDGTWERFWFLKASFGGSEEAAKTKDNTTDSNGSTMPFTAYPTKYVFAKNNEHAKVVRIDSTKTELIEKANWTAQVVTPDNLETICKAVAQSDPAEE